MPGLLQFITSADQFGALSQVSFFNDGKFRTIYGGILSLMIYSLGISYLVYLVYIWRTFQIPPTVTVQSQFDNAGSYFNLTSPPYAFSLEVDESLDQAFELQQKGDIFQYEISSYQLSGVNLTKNTQNSTGSQCQQPPKQIVDYNDPICMNLEDRNQTNLFQNYTNRNQDTYISIQIKYCNPSVNHKCLNFEDQSKIFNTQPAWRLTVSTQEINLKNRSITNIPQDYYFAALPFQNFSTNVVSLRIRKGTYVIDDGILFPSITKIEIVRSIELFQYVTQYNDTIDNVPMIADIEYHLDRTEEIITVTYPKLGQILADLGSILQVLLLFGLIMNQFNHTRMQVKIDQILLGIYFPEIKLFQFKYNWRGKIKSISWMGQLLRDFDFERMKVFKESMGTLLRSKLNYLNILHEISRVQIQQQLKIPKSELIQHQSTGYRLSLPKSVSIDAIDDNILDESDFQVLCLQKIELKEQDLVLEKGKQIFGQSSGLVYSPRLVHSPGMVYSPMDVSKQKKQKRQFLKSIQLMHSVKTKLQTSQISDLNALQRNQRQHFDHDSQLYQINDEKPLDSNFSNRSVHKNFQTKPPPIQMEMTPRSQKQSL